MEYKVGKLAELFDVSRETIRRWSQEFEAYLSSGANPESNMTRRYTESDATVMALIASCKNDGLTYEEIHAKLRTGERGVIPRIPTDSQKDMMLSQVYQQLQTVSAERDALAEEIQKLTDELSDSRETIAKMSVAGEELTDARKRIEDLIRQVAVLEYRLSQND